MLDLNASVVLDMYASAEIELIVSCLYYFILA